ncbi:hypothetical protein BpHYR1_010003, partial [Brachionus plicatilis]
ECLQFFPYFREDKEARLFNNLNGLRLCFNPKKITFCFEDNPQAVNNEKQKEEKKIFQDQQYIRSIGYEIKEKEI